MRAEGSQLTYVGYDSHTYIEFFGRTELSSPRSGRTMSGSPPGRTMPGSTSIDAGEDLERRPELRS